jgi:hypothetical protein
MERFKSDRLKIKVALMLIAKFKQFRKDENNNI